MPPAFLSCCPCQEISQKRDLSGRLSRIHFCDLPPCDNRVFFLHVIIAILQRFPVEPAVKHLQRLCVHAFSPCTRCESVPEAAQRGLRVRRVPVVSMGKKISFLISQLLLRELKRFPHLRRNQHCSYACLRLRFPNDCVADFAVGAVHCRFISARDERDVLPNGKPIIRYSERVDKYDTNLQLCRIPFPCRLPALSFCPLPDS